MNQKANEFYKKLKREFEEELERDIEEKEKELLQWVARKHIEEKEG